MNQARLHVVQPGDRPPPMLPPEMDLSELPDVLISRKDFLKGRLARNGSHEERIAAWTLYIIALDEEEHPASLPNEDSDLAFLAGYGRDVAAWRRIREQALQDWTLCSDGRFYHPDLAVRSLIVWLKRIAARRKTEMGRCKRYKRTFDGTKFDRQAAEAIKFLTALDPEAAILRNYHNPEPDVTPEAGSTSGPTTGSTSTKVKLKAKPEAQESSSEESSDESPENICVEGSEFGPVGGGLLFDGPPEPQARPPDPEPALAGEILPPWPAGAWKRFWEAWPIKDGVKPAEKSFERIRKNGLIGFDDLMAAVERYKRNKPQWQHWKSAAAWLNQERWNDPLARSESARGPPATEASHHIRTPLLRAAVDLGYFDEGNT